jgi:hypothetical protein
MLARTVSLGCDKFRLTKEPPFQPPISKVAHVRPSSPRHAGKKMLFHADKTLIQLNELAEKLIWWLDCNNRLIAA